MTDNLPVRSERRIIVPERREIARVNVKPRKHLRKYKSGKVAIVNPQIQPRHQVIILPRREVVPVASSGFVAKIQLPPRKQVLNSADALWERLRNDSTLGPFIESINNNIAEVKMEIFDEFKDNMKKGLSEEDAIEEFADDVEGGVWDDRWGHADNIFVKQYGDWKNYPNLNIVPSASPFDELAYEDEIWTPEHDPFDGQLFLKDKGTMASTSKVYANTKNFAMYNMRTSDYAAQILDRDPRNWSEDKRWLFDRAFLKTLIKKKIPFLHAVFGTNNTSDSAVYVPLGEESKVDKIYDELSKHLK